MDIADIQAGQGKIDIEAEVIKKGDIRTFDKFGKQGKVCSATIQDNTGEISLTLWNEQTDQINVGNKIRITNGYASEFKGERQLSTGKFGTLEIIENTTQDEKPSQPTESLPKTSEQTTDQKVSGKSHLDESVEEERVN